MWVETKYNKPEFDTVVLVWCRVYGRFLATYEHIGWGAGNWRSLNDGKLGILPPIYWMNIPEIPNKKNKLSIQLIDEKF